MNLSTYRKKKEQIEALREEQTRIRSLADLELRRIGDKIGTLELEFDTFYSRIRSLTCNVRTYLTQIFDFLLSSEKEYLDVVSFSDANPISLKIVFCSTSCSLPCQKLLKVTYLLEIPESFLDSPTPITNEDLDAWPELQKFVTLIS